MRRILLTGAKGQLGRECDEALLRAGFAVIAADHQSLDITSLQAVESAFEAAKPDAVINCAAYTKVDLAEDEEEKALAANAAGPGNLAECCARAGVPLLHVSTDYVFDSPLNAPHKEDEPPRAGCAYGRTKLEGERLIAAKADCHYLIVRAGGLFGRYGNNFPKVMLRHALKDPQLRVVGDQRLTPAPARALAEALVRMLQSSLTEQFDGWGIYHFPGLPSVSWYDFACAVLACARKCGLLGRDVPVSKITSAEYPVKAKRPSDSRLASEKIQKVFGISLPDWHDYLEETLRGEL
ncbi:MAG: dTDP-4-dehydrorhamnose reductase [Succinivibrio sp.]|jgi:dTDP-4-dehydrorhamnose reductase|nr:dTDP-4-dehydrorhamnose reductase [Succinivibrio sp.]